MTTRTQEYPRLYDRPPANQVNPGTLCKVTETGLTYQSNGDIWEYSIGIVQVENVLGACSLNYLFNASIRSARGFNHYFVCQDLPNGGLQIVVPSWYVLQSTHVENYVTGTIKLAVEYAGVVTRLTFGGSDTGTFPSSGEIVADPLPVPMSKGSIIKLKYWINSPTGLCYRDGQYNGPGGSAMEWSTSILSDNTLSNDVVTNTTANTSFQFIAGIASTDCISVVQVGNSIGAGQDDVPDSALSNGTVCRALRALGYADCNFSVAGDYLQLTNDNSTNRRAALKYYGNVIINSYRNDINAGQYVNTAKGVLINFIQQLPDNIGVFLTTLDPDTTTTNGFVDEAGQTLSANSPKLLALSNEIRWGKIPGVDGYFDPELAESTMSADGVTPTGKWVSLATGTGSGTTGGIHPNAAGNKLNTVKGVFRSPALKKPGYIRAKLSLPEITLASLTWGTSGAKTISLGQSTNFTKFYSNYGSVQTHTFSKTVSANDSLVMTNKYPESISTLPLNGKGLGGAYPRLELMLGLQTIDFTGNTFTGKHPYINDLVSLTSYTGQGVNPSGNTDPVFFMTQLSKLTSVIVTTAGFTGNVPSFSYNPAIVTVNLQFNAFTGIDAGFSIPITVKNLWLGGNLLTAAAVNAVLAACVVASNAGATGMNIKLASGNAAPTGQGLTDKAALIAAGHTVATS